MKKYNYQPAAFLTMVLLLSAILFSFTKKTAETVFGGEGFEIYLNNKLVLQQFGSKMNEVKNISLNQTDGNGELAIRYFHCGQPGKSRVVTIKDETNVVLKEWRFGDTKTADAKLCCNVKDILALPKIKAGKKVSLYYTSTELPGGRKLAILTTNDNSQVQP
jgi:hypothetical protein